MKQAREQASLGRQGGMVGRVGVSETGLRGKQAGEQAVRGEKEGWWAATTGRG